MTNEQYIEELETALEDLLECFETTLLGRPTIEVEVDNEEGFGPDQRTYFTEGTVNQTTAEAIAFATEVLYKGDEEWGGCEE